VLFRCFCACLPDRKQQSESGRPLTFFFGNQDATPAANHQMVAMPMGRAPPPDYSWYRMQETQNSGSPGYFGMFRLLVSGATITGGDLFLYQSFGYQPRACIRALKLTENPLLQDHDWKTSFRSMPGLFLPLPLLTPTTNSARTLSRNMCSNGVDIQSSNLGLFLSLTGNNGPVFRTSLSEFAARENAVGQPILLLDHTASPP